MSKQPTKKVGTAEEESQKMVKAHNDDFYADGIEDDNVERAVADLIARAKAEGAAEERDRCAKIAEHWATRPRGNTEEYERYRSRIGQAKTIASEIANGEGGAQ